MNKITIKLNKIFVIITLSILTSCLGPKTLQKQVNRKTYDATMVYTSPLVKKKYDVNLYFEFESETELSSISKVQKESGFFIPLFIVNMWKYKTNITLGNNSSEPTVSSTIENITQNVFNRSGKFNPVKNKDVADYTATLILKKINVKCDFQKSGVVTIISGSVAETVSNSNSEISIQLILKDKLGNIISDKLFSKTGRMGFAKENNNMRHTAMNNLIENSMLTTEALTLDILNYIHSKIKT